MHEEHDTETVLPADVDHESQERRTFLITGAVFLGALVLVIIAAALISGGADRDTDTTPSTDACPADDTVCEGEQRAAERPGIIPDPGEGRAPEEAGDPGGAAQLAVLAGIVVALAVIVALVVLSSRRAHVHRPTSTDPTHHPDRVGSADAEHARYHPEGPR